MQNHIVCAYEKHFHKHKSTLYSNVKPQDKKFLFVFTLAFHYLCLMENTPNIYAACFSPTGRTNLLVQHIAHNISCLLQNRTITDWNFTLPIQRNTPLQAKKSDWVIVGLPVYAGRLPNLLLPYLNSWTGNGATAIPIVTFGNRSYGNALIELKELLESKGFKIAGTAAFVAEHAFAQKLAKGRPNDSDLQQADIFAENAYKRWHANHNSFPPINVPGTGAPDYGGYYQPLGEDGSPVRFLKARPIVIKEKCNNCGCCADVCPMGSIEKGNNGNVTGICIKCNACIKVCPMNARLFTDEAYLSHIRYLESHYAKKEAKNELF